MLLQIITLFFCIRDVDVKESIVKKRSTSSPESLKDLSMQNSVVGSDVESNSEISSPLDFTAVSESWCGSCDVSHDDVEVCPFRKPAFVFTDSVIDFSSKELPNERCV